MKTQMQILVYMLFVIFCFITTPIIAQQTESERKVCSVIVMPFFIDEPYPYRFDLVREALIIGLWQKGFKVVTDDSSWSKVFDFDYPFYNLSDDMADSIATAIGADLIIFGRINYSVKFRPGGLYTEQITPNPILIKVFDAKKKSIALFERVDFVQRWGLFVSNLTLNDFGVQIATQLSQRGY